MIEPTDEMVTAAAEVAEDEMIRRLGRDLGTIHRDDIIRAILAACLAIVERDYDVLPKFRPHAHAFVRGDDPSFGSVFGGGCVVEVNGMICGWPEQAHRGRPL